MNISGEDIFYLIICVIGVILSFVWIKYVCKFCFNNEYRSTVKKNIHETVMHEFMCIFVPAPILVGISSIITIIYIFIGII